MLLSTKKVFGEHAAQSRQIARLFLQSSKLGPGPTPLPAKECHPPLPLWFRGVGTHSLAGEGVGGSQFRRGDRHCGIL
jgi:hypothetical protein